MKRTIILSIIFIFCGLSHALDVIVSADFDSKTVISKDLNVSSTATINLKGGRYEDDLKVYDNAKVKIRGNTVVIDGVGLYSDKTSTIEDGYIGGQVFVGNEEVSHTLEITGGEFHGRLWTYKESLVTITGHDFNHPYGDVRRILEEFDPESGVTTYAEINREGNIAGVLENGDPIDFEFRIMGDSNIILIKD